MNDLLSAHELINMPSVRRVFGGHTIQSHSSQNNAPISLLLLPVIINTNILHTYKLDITVI